MKEKFIVKRIRPYKIDYFGFGIFHDDIFHSELLNTHENARQYIDMYCKNDGYTFYQIEKVFVP